MDIIPRSQANSLPWFRFLLLQGRLRIGDASIIGNTDNHGRNMAFFRTNTGFRLTPSYDLAPMVADPAGISRATVWEPDDRYYQVASRYANDADHVWRLVQEGFLPLKEAVLSVKNECPEAIKNSGRVFRLPEVW